ncbi:protein AMN1 homolog [Mizuhopecten yessoensis]|uniref:protein AMN1 homolog n=1 Tax=Mizuhopecten yessoensis TaxID=6573 RepID=UPI000B45B1BE|nr:protein AMN1 homolog [Mizuhopecten yessoensis]
MAAFCIMPYGKVTTLLDRCVQCLVSNLATSIEGLETLPGHLKDKCVYLMSKRGLITDTNISKVLHEKLKVLDLSECEVSDAGLQHLSKCLQLKKIDLNSAKLSRGNISSEGILNVTHTCTQLQTVYVRRCINLTDEAVIALSKSCPQLRLLNVGGCHLLTDRSLLALGENSHFLKSVNFSKTKVTDNGVVGLVSGSCAKTLKEVHMDGCVNLTDEAVEGVLQFCPQISILLFHGCPKITDQSREALEQLTIDRAEPMKQVTWTVY